MRLFAFALIACGCRHVYEVKHPDAPVPGECVRVASDLGKFKPVHFYVGGERATSARIDTIVDADAGARAVANRDARRLAATVGLLLGGSAIMFAVPMTLLVKGAEAADARIGLAATGGVALAAGFVLIALRRRTALDVINERARAEGRCPPD